MRRRCDGSDPNLVRNDPPWDPSKLPGEQTVGPGHPCDCGRVFDDVERMVIFPHPFVSGGDRLAEELGLL